MDKMKKGFTLIELITVVIIIAILAALALPQYTRFIERSQGSTARTALGVLRKAEANYFALNSTYVGCTDGTLTNCPLVSETPEVSKIMNGTTEWNYTISSPNPGDKFTAVATRQKGVYTGGTITLYEDGSSAIGNGTLSGNPNPSGLW